MIGNDVVDLRDPETRADALHPRFDDRIMNDVERARVAASTSSHACRWMHWALKEAAYKAVRRVEPEAVFAPARIAVARLERVGDGLLTGRIVWNGRELAARATVERDHVHAVAFRGLAASDVVAVCAALPPGDDPRQAVRALATREIERTLGLSRGSLAIRSEARAPVLVAKDGAPTRALSLSHHGGYVAFAWSAARCGVAA